MKVSDLESIAGLLLACCGIAASISVYLRRVIRREVKPIHERIDSHMEDERKGQKKLTKQMKKMRRRQRATDRLVIERLLPAVLDSDHATSPDQRSPKDRGRSGT